MHKHRNNSFLIRKNLLNNPTHDLVDPKNQFFLYFFKYIFPSFLTLVSSIDKRGTRVWKVPLIARIISCIEQSVSSFHHANNDG
jgi:hypothetical protein